MRMERWFPAILVAGVACLTGCQGIDAEFFRLPPELTLKRTPSPLEEILSGMPSVQWEASSHFTPSTDYLAIPGEHSYYLFRDGLQYIDEHSAMRYTRHSSGFELLTIEQRDGLYKHPICPADAFAFSCVENHSIIIATNITCGTVACDYDFAVFDYQRKFRFSTDSPALKTIVNYMLDEEEETYYFPYQYNEEFEVKHRTSGNITPENPLWLDYLRERRDLLRDVLDYAVTTYNIRLIDDKLYR